MTAMIGKVKCIIAVGFVALVFLLFLIGLGKQGAVDLYQQRLERDRMKQDNVLLEGKNEDLYRTIRRLKEDPEFVENIARTQLGMIREDEMVILKKKR
jgi:cell division protein FtsB